IIDASWSVATTNIPKQLNQINAAFQSLCGGYLSTCLVDAETWSHVIANEHVIQQSGSSNSPWLTYSFDHEEQLARTMKNVQTYTLRSNPSVTWHVTDEVIEIGSESEPKREKIIPDNQCIFIGHSPDDGTVTMNLGSEPVVQYEDGPETTPAGIVSWSRKRANPAKTEIYTLDNALPVTRVPKSRAIGEVIF
ncbi:MAG: hypothetical protein AAFP90_21960, partial [Planctomycetota bacterium]